MKIIFALAFYLMSINQVAAQGLEKYEWKNRLVLLFTDNPSQRIIIEQKEELLEGSDGFNDRDLLLFIIGKSSVVDESGRTSKSLNPNNLRDLYDVSPSDGFQFILIGKDGTEKLRSKEMVTKDKLWGIIDAMPMRKREMRNN